MSNPVLRMLLGALLIGLLALPGGMMMGQPLLLRLLVLWGGLIAGYFLSTRLRLFPRWEGVRGWRLLLAFGLAFGLSYVLTRYMESHPSPSEWPERPPSQGSWH